MAVNDSAARVPVGYGDRNPIFYGDEMILHSCKLDKDRVRSVLKYLNQAQIVLDLKPVKHSWEVLGRSVQQLIVALGRGLPMPFVGSTSRGRARRARPLDAEGPSSFWRIRSILRPCAPHASGTLWTREYFTADLTDHLAEPRAFLGIDAGLAQRQAQSRAPISRPTPPDHCFRRRRTRQAMGARPRRRHLPPLEIHFHDAAQPG